MHCDHLHSMIPLERYRDIIAAIGAKRESWADSFWMRFAAQAAVLCPDPPEQLAKRIHHIASALQQRTAWYRTLASPVRFVVAAMLIQHHIPVADFLGECDRASEVFKEVGLHHHGFYETMAVLILRLSAKHPAPSLIQADRIKSLYDHMKGFHWWLTGPSDLPACAALASCPGPAEVVVAHVEDAYQQLKASGLARNHHLQTAANLLPVLGVPIDEGVSRYRALKMAFEVRNGVLDVESYDALVVLALIHQTTDIIINRLFSVREELDLFQPEQCGPANFLIAADLTVLDLVRFGPDQEQIRQPQDVESMMATIHAFHIASAVLVSQVQPEMIQPLGCLDAMGWPYPYA